MMNMNLDPITALLAPIEKLITEHGSAVILREKVSLLREQLVIIKEKFSVLAMENERLKAENQYLKAKVDQLEKKIESYNKSAHASPLNEIETNILLLLAEQEYANITPEQISESLIINLQIIAFHLEDLRAKGMIESRPIAPFDHTPRRFWSLAQEGRRFLMKHELVS